MTNRAEVAAESMRAAPPVAAAGLSLAGVTLNDVVLLVTLVYVVLQTAYLLSRWCRQRRQDARDDAREEEAL